jgi:DNA-binding MarR family transcriptional regulator
MRDPIVKIHIFANLAEKEIERKLLEELGISYSQSMILSFIRNHPEISQRQVAMERGITPAAVSRHLEVLEEMGLIRRKDREDNKREHILVVTDSGANIVSNAEELLDLAMDEIMSDVSKTEAENMNKIIEKLLTRFKDMI